VFVARRERGRRGGEREKTWRFRMDVGLELVGLGISGLMVGWDVHVGLGAGYPRIKVTISYMVKSVLEWGAVTVVG
jgi:hypothetical protein